MESHRGQKSKSSNRVVNRKSARSAWHDLTQYASGVTQIEWCFPFRVVKLPAHLKLGRQISCFGVCQIESSITPIRISNWVVNQLSQSLISLSNIMRQWSILPTYNEWHFFWMIFAERLGLWNSLRKYNNGDIVILCNRIIHHVVHIEVDHCFR